MKLDNNLWKVIEMAKSKEKEIEIEEIETEDVKNSKKKKIQKEETVSEDIRTLPGIGPSTAKLLIEHGFGTIQSLAVASIAELSDIPGIGEKMAEKLVRSARECFDIGIKTLQQKKEDGGNRKRISTLSEDLNTLLGGGIESGSITEFVGEYRTGKTQIALTLSVVAQLKEEHGGLLTEKDLKAGKLISVGYVDTEGTCRYERVEMIARGIIDEFGIDYITVDQILENIRLGRAYNSDLQIAIVEEFLADAQKSNMKLMIVDSLTALFRAEFIGRGTLAARQQKLGKHLGYMNKMVEAQNLACMITNQVHAKPDQLFGDPNQAVGGNIVAHGTTHRIMLRKGSKEERKAVLIDSPLLAESTATYKITAAGIRDTK